MDELNFALSEEIIDDVCFLAATRPNNNEVISWFRENHEYDLSKDQLIYIREHFSHKIKEYKKGGIDSINKGIQLGTLPYTSLYNRIATLNTIVDQCINGYAQEKANSRGEIIYETVKNFGSAIAAINLMSNLMTELPKEDEFYEVVIGEIDAESKDTIKRLSLPSGD